VDRAVSKEPPFAMWDQRFGSRFLQRRVTNEPSSASSTRGKAAFRMVSSRSFGNDHLIASLAWCPATATAKRRQGGCRPERK